MKDETGAIANECQAEWSRLLCLRRYQSLFEGAGLASRSMSFPAAMIVEGVPGQPAAAAHMARTDARPTAAEDTAGPYGQRRHRAYVATFRFGKVQPSSPSACRAAASCQDLHSM